MRKGIDTDGMVADVPSTVSRTGSRRSGQEMSKIQIRQVEAFRAVVTLRSMTKAAEFLGISQPAVSRLIADFQTTVGFKLFKRGRNSAEPTPDAQLLFEQVDKLFHGLEELGQQIHAITNLHIGKLTVAATNSHASGFLPTMLSSFKRENTGIVLSYHIQPHEQVLDWVSSGRADIGFVIQPVAKSDLTAVTLASREAHCIFPQGHPFEQKAVLKPRDFQNERFVSFARGTALRFLIDGFFQRHNVDRVLHVEAASHQSICAFVAEGMGVSLVNPFAPTIGFPNPILARPVQPSVLMEAQMVYNEASMSSVCEKFRDYMLKLAPEMLKP